MLVSSLGGFPAIEVLVLSRGKRFDEALAPYRKPHVLLDHARQQHEVLLSAGSPLVVVFLRDIWGADLCNSRVIVQPADVTSPADPGPSIDEESPCCCQ